MQTAEPRRFSDLSPQAPQYVTAAQSAADRQVRNGATPGAANDPHAALPVATSIQQSWFGHACVWVVPLATYEMSPLAHVGKDGAAPPAPPRPPTDPPAPEVVASPPTDPPVPPRLVPIAPPSPDDPAAPVLVPLPLPQAAIRRTNSSPATSGA